MKLSIVMPSWNQASYIKAALDSVFEQNYPDLEVIVMDGGSSDGTVDILSEYSRRHSNLIWRSEPDEGPADAVNKALAIANGDICGIHSTDDRYLEGAFEAVSNTFADNPKTQMVFGDVTVINGSGETIAENEVPEFSWEAWCGIALAVPQGSIFFKTQLAQELGGWRGEIFGCDLDLWLRMLFRTTPVKVQQALSAWRVYEEQRTTPQHYQKILKGFRQMIDESEDIPKAPLRVRRLTIAAKHLAAVHFSSKNALWFKRWHALLALVLHPTFPRYAYGSLLKELLPGIHTFRKTKTWLSR
jgi:glycosyltransferase involved in cell wall biosynthesis